MTLLSNTFSGCNSLVCFLRLFLDFFLQLAEDGGLDWNLLTSAVKPKTKCALIQRSCGYSWRRSLSVNDIGRAIKIIKVGSHTNGTLAIYSFVLFLCKAVTLIFMAFCSLKCTGAKSQLLSHGGQLLW